MELCKKDLEFVEKAEEKEIRDVKKSPNMKISLVGAAADDRVVGGGGGGPGGAEWRAGNGTDRRWKGLAANRIVPGLFVVQSW